MAMISCPECGKTISDKAEKCIHCGHIMIEKNNVRTCSECGTIITDEMEVCPTCGCPVEKVKEDTPQKVEVTNVKLAVDKRKIKLIIGIIVAIIIAIGGIFTVKIIKKNNAKKAYENTKLEYEQNYKECVDLMLEGAGKAENVGGMIHDVWANTIYEKSDSRTNKYTKSRYGGFNDDFNTSLALYMTSDEYLSDVDEINDIHDEVQELMKKLKNPPDEYEDAYDALKDFYDAYLKLVNLATDPSGNLQTYTTSFNNADTDALNYYKAALLYVED